MKRMNALVLNPSPYRPHEEVQNPTVYALHIYQANWDFALLRADGIGMGLAPGRTDASWMIGFY